MPIKNEINLVYYSNLINEQNNNEIFKIKKKYIFGL